jgi:H+/Cl- antiporter ClcA
MGITVAFMNFISDNQTAGTGQKETLMMLNGESFGLDFVLFKYIATLASFVSTIAGGLFMTSITIGGGLGFEISALYSNISPQVIMIMAMISYLSGVIRAPLTSAFLVLEMTNSLNLLFPAIIVSFLASIVSKQISNRPLYETIASNYLILTSKH